MDLLAVLVAGQAAVWAADTTVSVPSWASYAATIAVAAIGSNWWLRRSQNRLNEASADERESAAVENKATAGETMQRTYDKWAIELEEKLSVESRKAAETNALLIQAQGEANVLSVELQQSLEQGRKERHALKALLDAQAEEVARLRGELRAARERIETLEVRLGAAEERRVNVADGRITLLESRAAAGEAKADRTDARADRAADVADRQEHRNDDTPGHA